jgi:NAD(P)-dependent dehydrogenase (short-subunit alcohol dehydrogenase family)
MTSQPEHSAQSPLKPAIVVTGATSGIERELARAAAREGSIMVLLDQAQPAVEDLVAEAFIGQEQS